MCLCVCERFGKIGYERDRLARPRAPKYTGAVIPVHHDPKKEGCLHRVPYGSLMATSMCVIGVVLFAVMMSWAFNATAEQTRRTLRIDDWPWLDKVQVFFIVLAVLMSLFSLFFLIIGFTATGVTRETMYKNDESKCGGKFACVVAMIFDFLLTICWLFIISIVSMMCISYHTFDRLCYSLPAYTEADCIDFHVFIPLIASFANTNLRVCGGDAQQFCALSATASTWYIVGWVGCAVIILGLLLFFGIHAANYAHIGNSNRYVEINQYGVEVPPSPPHFAPPRTFEDELRYNDRYTTTSKTYTSRPISTSRGAEHMSDSVSQLQYGRNNKRRLY
ncbi:unnamed protein product [Caenorhabditis auriculariae]|uniref:Uncharacterized protein n=1 Tax=Caenorhabditis auriculariae TaxID=2777116 RepID=A0A8S1HBL0_9PELO|nr:unnamed protein product [Caenorhabditis auriculariae]